MAHNDTLTVFFDGSCPLCTREIGFYQRRRGAEQISWIDVSAGDHAEQAEVAPGLTRRAAMARFHVMPADGRIISGGRAFAEILARLPAFSLIGRILRRRPFVWLLDGAYELFLPLRPRLQRLFGAPPPACPRAEAVDGARRPPTDGSQAPPR